MGIINKAFNFLAGTPKTGEAAQVNADFDALYALVNGSLDDANISAIANIQQAKINNLQTDLGARLLKAGDTMSGNLVIYLASPTFYLEDATSGQEWAIQVGNGQLLFYVNTGSHVAPVWVVRYTINSSGSPVNSADLTTKVYVDGRDNALIADYVARDSSLNNALFNDYVARDSALFNDYVARDAAISIGAGNIRTAQGSATADLDGDFGLNELSFFPSLGGTGNNWYVVTASQNPGVATGLMGISGGTGTWVVRWNYITATDNPRVYCACDNATGEILGAWCADDPCPDAYPGIKISASQNLEFASADLQYLNLSQASLDGADQKIAANHLKPENRLYRALQIEANDEAPSGWIIANCKIQDRNLVRK